MGILSTLKEDATARAGAMVLAAGALVATAGCTNQYQDARAVRAQRPAASNLDDLGEVAMTKPSLDSSLDALAKSLQAFLQKTHEHMYNTQSWSVADKNKESGIVFQDIEIAQRLTLEKLRTLEPGQLRTDLTGLNGKLELLRGIFSEERDLTATGQSATSNWALVLEAKGVVDSFAIGPNIGK